MFEATCWWNIVDGLWLSVGSAIATCKDEIILGAVIRGTPFTFEALIRFARLIPLKCPFRISEFPRDIEGLRGIINAIRIWLTSRLDSYRG